MGGQAMTHGMRHSTSRRGGKAVPRSARAVWGGIGAGVLAAFLASPAPAAGLSPDWDRDARNGGTLPVWIAAVVERKLPLLEPGKPQLVQLAAATVADQVLAEIRGGFISVLGMEIDIGFDFRTFINGVLRVHDVASPTDPDGGSLPLASTSSSSNTVVTFVSTGNGVTQVINDILSSGGAGGSDGGVVANVISSTSGDGTLNSTTAIITNDSGVTQVINQINNDGGVSTTITNTASGLDINQINTTTIAVLDPGLFIGRIPGGPFGGTPHLPIGLFTGLIGVIAR